MFRVLPTLLQRAGTLFRLLLASWSLFCLSEVIVRRYSVKKVFFKNLAKLTGMLLCWSLYFQLTLHALSDFWVLMCVFWPVFTLKTGFHNGNCVFHWCRPSWNAGWGVFGCQYAKHYKKTIFTKIPWIRLWECKFSVKSLICKLVI